MTAMSAEVVFPVRIRVGDTEEAEIGTVTVDLATGNVAALYGGLADFFRAVADDLDKRTPPERTPE